METKKIIVFLVWCVLLFAITKGLDVSADSRSDVKAPSSIVHEDCLRKGELEDSCKSSQTVVDITNPSVIRDTLNLLKQGDVEILLNDDKRDVILVLGNTGAGKSTFTQWISKDDSGLMAVDTAGNKGEYIIVDNNNRVGNTTIKSKTTFPEQVTDPNNNYTYYDFPGFSDTRSTSNDIVTSYFIKKIVEHVERIKIVIVVSHPSVRKGIDRQDFMKLVTHITELIKDIEKYRHGIALVVTKVDNQYKKNKGLTTLVSDETIIERISFFLQEVRDSSINESKHLNINSKERLLFENTVKLIDILLTDKVLPKIALFRRPDESGPIDSNSLLIEEKEHVRELIADNLIFVIKNNEDFGFTISQKSKNDIMDIAEEIHRNILTIVSTISNEIKTVSESLIKQADVTINSFNISDTNSLDYVLSRVEYLNGKLSQEYHSLLKLVQDLKITKDVEELSKNIDNRTKDLNIQKVNENVARLLVQARYFNFICEVSGREFILHTNSLAWASAFQSLVSDLSEPKARIQNNTNHIATTIDSIIKLNILEKFASLQHKICDTKMVGANFKHKLENLKKTHQNLSNTKDKTVLTSVFKLLEDMNIQLTDHTKVNIKNHNKYYELVRHEIGNIIEFVENSLKWNNFTAFLFDKLAEYKIQNDTSKCAKFSQNIFGTGKPYQIQDTNLFKFMHECFGEGYEQEYNAVKFVKLDPSKTAQLKSVLQQTLLQNPKRICNGDGKLTVRGSYVKLSEVFSKECSPPISIIEIFALDKVFIDHSMYKTGEKLQFYIVAPTWEIIGHQTIKLDGHDGESYRKEKADDGKNRGSDGIDGLPGRPGGPSGNFFGIAETIINSRGLTISASGGNGGRGQDGGNGRKGIDGSSPSEMYSSVSNSNNKEHYIYNGIILTIKTVEVKGDKCTDGGNAGVGGHGGAGGIEGKVVLYGSSNDINVKIIRNRGKTGPHGSSGSPGKAGHYGKNLVFKVRIWRFTLLGTIEKGYVLSRETFKCEAGHRGIQVNVKGMESPQQLPDNQEMFVRDYETYAMQNVNQTITRHNLNEFYKNIAEKI